MSASGSSLDTTLPATISGRRPAALHLARQPFRHRRRIRQRLVIFQIPAHHHAIRRRTQLPHPLRIPRALHQKRPRMCQRIAQKRPQIKSCPPKKFLISRKRLIRNPSAHKNHRHLARIRLAQEIRPNLRLQHNHQRRLHRIQRPAHAKRPVKRKINHRVGRLHPFARQRLPRLCCSGNNQRPLRIRRLQFLRQRHSRQNLAHRHRVNPDRPGPSRRHATQPRKRSPQSLAQIRKILPLPQPFPNPNRRKHRRSKRHQKAVNEIHSVKLPQSLSLIFCVVLLPL